MKYLCIGLVGFCIASTAMAAEPARWQPAAIGTYDIQLNDPPSLAAIPNVSVIELDIDTAPNLLMQVRARGAKTICYFNAGAWESYRSDKNAFPKAVLGKGYDGYPDERWLDIRNINALAPIMRARMDSCKKKGFVAIDPDNVNGYENKTGFALTAAHQLAYNRWLLKEAHARGLAIALKNTPALAATLANDGYDFVVSESCFADGFCDKFTPFIQRKRPVLDLEYLDEGMTLKKFCADARKLGINALLKRSSSSIDSYRATCS